jgi:hypothetical protein
LFKITKNSFFLEKLLVAQLVEQFAMLYGIGRFITLFTTFCRFLYTEQGESRMKVYLHFRMCVFVSCVCKLKTKYLKMSFCMLLFGGGNLISHSSGERRLRVFEVEVLRGMFGPKRAKVAGGCRKL